MPVEGFDLGNSPSQILRRGAEFFDGKVVVQRTSAGVQGALAALEAADEVLLGSFMVARATANIFRPGSPGGCLHHRHGDLDLGKGARR